MTNNKPVYVVGHRNPDTDSICSAIAYANLKNKLGTEAVAVRCGKTNAETDYALDYFKVDAPMLVEKLESSDEDVQSVILVDHNEFGQAVEGIESAKLVEVVDHHRMGGLQTSDPIYINVQPVGCTATIISNLYWQNNVELPKEIAGILLSAILSDTVLFKSPTCTQLDKDTCDKLAAAAGVDINEYGMAMLKAGAGIGDMTPAEIAKTDLKEFKIGDYSIIVSQISVMDPSEVLDIKAQMVEAMEGICKAEGYDMSLVMVTDILNESTDLLYVGSPVELLKAAFEKDVEDNCIHLPGVMSRKKQIIPPLSEAVKRI